MFSEFVKLGNMPSMSTYNSTEKKSRHQRKATKIGIETCLLGTIWGIATTDGTQPQFPFHRPTDKRVLQFLLTSVTCYRWFISCFGLQRNKPVINYISEHETRPGNNVQAKNALFTYVGYLKYALLNKYLKYLLI